MKPNLVKLSDFWWCYRYDRYLTRAILSLSKVMIILPKLLLKWQIFIAENETFDGYSVKVESPSLTTRSTVLEMRMANVIKMTEYNPDASKMKKFYTPTCHAVSLQRYRYIYYIYTAPNQYSTVNQCFLQTFSI